MERVARTSIVDVVIARLRDEIRNGNWPVGTKIPTEATLVDVLGVSRPSVREAVRSLVQAGLLESRQGDGTYVVAEDETTVALQRVVDAADRAEAQLVRHTLEVLAAREAATHRSKADVDALRVALQGRRTAKAKATSTRSSTMTSLSTSAWPARRTTCCCSISTGLSKARCAIPHTARSA